jgi:hypothetical protein
MAAQGHATIPQVFLNELAKGVPAKVAAKLESLEPCNRCAPGGAKAAASCCTAATAHSCCIVWAASLAYHAHAALKIASPMP